MDQYERPVISSEAQYGFLATEVHKAIRQLILENAEKAREILTLAVAESENWACILPDKALDSRDLREYYNRLAKELAEKKPAPEKDRPRLMQGPPPQDFYKKQYAKLLSGLDDALSLMEGNLYTDAQCILELALIEAEEAYIQFGPDEA